MRTIRRLFAPAILVGLLLAIGWLWISGQSPAPATRPDPTTTAAPIPIPIPKLSRATAIPPDAGRAPLTSPTQLDPAAKLSIAEQIRRFIEHLAGD